MKLPYSFLILWLCVNYVTCYFYPVCYPNNGDRFHLTHTFQDVVNNLKSKIFNEKKEVKIECNNNERIYSDIITFLSDLKIFLSPLIHFYNRYLQLDINWNEFSGLGSCLPRKYYNVLYQYIPILQKETKVKTDGRLYLLFIGGTLTVYLLLYAYFTKKLGTLYQSNIKKQYINNIKKIFRHE